MSVSVSSVMAWPMIESVLDQYFADAFTQDAYKEQSVIVLGALESVLAPLMQPSLGPELVR